MSQAHLNDLIHHNEPGNGKATGTFTVSLDGAPFPLPPEKRLDFEKHLGDELFETRWIGRRVGEQPDANYQAVVLAISDSVPDGTHQVTYFGDVTVTYALVKNNLIVGYEAREGELTLTSDRTSGQEHIYGTFTNCRMVQDAAPQNEFRMSGTYDLKDVRIIP
ncbi:hypothetical protein [Pseudomonas pergaminensis]